MTLCALDADWQPRAAGPLRLRPDHRATPGTVPSLFYPRSSPDTVHVPLEILPTAWRQQKGKAMLEVSLQMRSVTCELQERQACIP